MRVKKDDTVVVIAGKDKGKKGKVVAVLPKQDKVVVEGVNIITKHQKPTGKGTRVRFEMKDGKKVRVAVKSGKEI